MWHNDFPALAALAARGITYLDSAATAQKPAALLLALQTYLSQGAANVHRAGYRLADEVTSAFEACRDEVAAFIGAAQRDEIAFTRSATEAFNLLAYGLEAQINPGDELLLSPLEHHANLLPWQQLAARRDAKLVWLPISPSGHIDVATASALFSPSTKLLAVTQLSNVLGTLQPVRELCALAAQHGALSVVDGAQGIVHGSVDVRALGCDFYVFSAHKLYGPDGLGVLYGHQHLLSQLPPWQFGGEMVQQVNRDSASFQAAPLRFEAGTPPISAVLALRASLAYLRTLQRSAVAAHEIALLQQLKTGLDQRTGIRRLGDSDAALVSFVVDGVHHADLAQLLDEQGIAVRSGQHCAHPLMATLGVAGSTRVSLGLYSQAADLERFFIALDNALALLQ